MRDILAWVVAVELLGVAVLPLLRAFFDNRRDAALLCRPLGLALVAYVAWGLTLVGFPFERIVIMMAVGLVGIVSWLVHRRSGKAVPVAAWIAGLAYCVSLTKIGEGALERLLLVVAFAGFFSLLAQRPEEKRAAIFFWASTGVFLAIRAAWPEILGQEKFMDLAFLNSLTRNTNMPPVDPWMAGRTINYYYWGYLLAAAATKLANISTFVSYNLAIATFAGYSSVAAASLGLRLAKGRLAVGIAAAMATVFAGNLSGAFDGWGYLLRRGFDYFHASRVIASGDTINEFPFFTFFQADLHPHLSAFPYFIAAFAVGHRFLVREPTPPEQASGVWGFLRVWSPALLLTLVGGTAIAANPWTLPAIGILMASVCVFRKTRGRELPKFGEAIAGLIGGLLLLFIAYELWFAYEASYSLTSRNPNEHGLARTTMTSGLLEFLGVWGIFFVAGLASVWLHPAEEIEEAGLRRRDFALAVAAALSLLVALTTHAPALVVLIPFLWLTARVAWRALRESHDADEGFAAFLLLLGLAMVTGCEFIHFKDTYGDRLQRMNTIFKFYNQAWPLIAVAVVVFVEKLWRELRGRRRVALAGFLMTCAVAALLYPAAATVQRLRQRAGAPTLNARGALERRNPADAAAIAWLQRNLQGGTVLLEATGDPYSEFARISTHTGIPTVMGWANHEGLWRENDPEIGERARLVRAFYTARDQALIYQILQKYKVTHVVLGELEARTYPGASNLASLAFLEPVFSGATTVFRVEIPRP